MPRPRVLRVGAGKRRLALLGLALLLAGCGGGNERLTRAEYVEQADAICARYDRAVEGLPRPRRPAEVVEYTDKALVEFDKALADERKLRPPRELEPKKRRWLEAARKVRQQFVALREAARRSDLAGISAALAQGARDDARQTALAAELGLKVCSRP